MQKPANYHQLANPVDFTVNGMTWRLAYYAQMQEPNGDIVLACTAVPIVDGQPRMAQQRDMSSELHSFATVVAGILCDFSCCDRHADERALSVITDIVTRMRAGRAWNAAHPNAGAGKPN